MHFRIPQTFRKEYRTRGNEVYPEPFAWATAKNIYFKGAILPILREWHSTLDHSQANQADRQCLSRISTAAYATSGHTQTGRRRMHRAPTNQAAMLSRKKCQISIPALHPAYQGPPPKGSVDRARSEDGSCRKFGTPGSENPARHTINHDCILINLYHRRSPPLYRSTFSQCHNPYQYKIDSVHRIRCYIYSQ